jgi:hypothetical protein
MFDGLNRYYAAEEHASLGHRLVAAPEPSAKIVKFSNFKPAAADKSHPDHPLATLLFDMDMVRLPLAPADMIVERLLTRLDVGHPDQRANAEDAAYVHLRLFGMMPSADWNIALSLAANATIRELYYAAVASDAFRITCGRISASSAW